MEEWGFKDKSEGIAATEYLNLMLNKLTDVTYKIIYALIYINYSFVF